RMAAILQDVDSVFETDALRPLVDLAEELSGRSYSEGGPTTRAMRILADHSRGTAAMIADGVVPSNEDRGYVLRRIMRRAIQHGVVLGFASGAPPTRFVGYEKLRAETSLLAVQGEDGRALVKLEESPFYAEGGGQVADSGEVRWDGGSAKVADVYRIGDDQAVELERSLDGLAQGARVEAEVDHV